MRCCNFGKLLPIIVPESYRGKIHVFRQEKSKVVRILLHGSWSLPLHYKKCWSYEHCHSKKTTTAKASSQLTTVEDLKKLSYILELKDVVFHFLVQNWTFSRKYFLQWIRSDVEEKVPDKPELADENFDVYSLMIYTDLIECNIVGDLKALLLRCFPFLSKLKAGDIITTGQYKNYQTFSNLQFRPLLKNSFHSIHTDLRDTRGKKTPFWSFGITRLVLMFQKAYIIQFHSYKTLQDGCSKTSGDSAL